MRRSANSLLMNLRHAAALALVGWYLMVPPFIKVGDRVVPDSSALLSKWYWAGSFDSVDACERNQEGEIVKAQKRKLAQPTAKRGRSVEMGFWEARCIATDDPRLKGKLNEPEPR
jgi:hypothetical protein